MKEQKLTKVHLSDNSFDKLKAMRNSISPSADFRKSIRRQYSLYVLSEPTRRCQTLLLNIVVFQLLLIIGAILVHIYYPTLICNQLINYDKSIVTGHLVDKRKCMVKGIQKFDSIDLRKSNLLVTIAITNNTFPYFFSRNE